MIGDAGRRTGPAVGALAASYFVLASLMWEVNPTWGSAFWPAAGVTFAVLVRSPMRRWPLLVATIAAAELTVNLLHGVGGRTAVLGAVANAVEPAVGAWIFRKVGRQRQLVGLESLAWLLVGGVLAGPALGAAFGGVLAVGGPAPAPERWIRWWVGDGVGVLAVAPALLAGRGIWWRRAGAETAGFVAAIAATSAFLASSTPGSLAIAPSLLIPVLVWAALRFGVPGAGVSLVVIASVVHWATATGHGVFAAAERSDLVAAQVFIASIGLSCLTMALLVDDLDRRRGAEAELVHRATHDPLTGLPNRSQLEVRAARGGVGAVGLVDLDGFKAINDAHGHGVGDEVLVEVARRLRAACGPGDLVARLGGDEFVILLDGPADHDRLSSVEDALRRALLLPLESLPSGLPIEATVGWALSDGDPLGDLLEHADRRMYEQKRARPARPAR